MTLLTDERGRITARVPQKVQDTLQQAAELVGATLNQFVVQAKLSEAAKPSIQAGLQAERECALGHQQSAITLRGSLPRSLRPAMAPKSSRALWRRAGFQKRTEGVRGFGCAGPLRAGRVLQHAHAGASVC